MLLSKAFVGGYSSMLLIPQLYLKNGEVLRPENTTSPYFDASPLIMAEKIKAAGAETIYITDLNVPTSGKSPHLEIIQNIQRTCDLSVVLEGKFKSVQAVQNYIDANIELIALDQITYQEPKLVQEICKAFPKRIAAHIDIKAGKVVIPGWTVAANKSGLDYAERFYDYGISYILYSDTESDGSISQDCLVRTKKFCQTALTRTILSNEITNLAEIENIIELEAPRLEGIIINKSLYQGLIDLRSAHTFVANLLVDSGNELTLMDE